MVFNTPTARNGDADSATSIDSAAFYTRQEAALLPGSKLIDFNAAVIHINNATPNVIYCRIGTSGLWPEQPATNDGTHFCQFGGYTLGKWIAFGGMRAAALPVRAHLLDTAGVFNASQPLNPAVTTAPDTLYTYVGTDTTRHWQISCGTDTVLRKPSATICSTIVTKTDIKQAVTAPVSGAANSLSVNALSGKITFSGLESGNAKFIVYSLTGQKLLQKIVAISPAQGSLQWEELGALSQGNYLLEMKINGKSRAKVGFQKL